MKNIRSKIKRFFAMLLITATLVNTAVMDYSTTVYATSGVITMSILDALLATFGISVGLGNQSDFFSQSNFDELSTAISNGHVYHMDNYGDVDFSDSVEIAGWLDWANGIEPYLRTPGSAPIIAYGTGVKACAIELDKISYNLTGTCATTALNSYISEFIGDYNASSEALAEDIRTTFTVINGGGDPGDDDDKEKAAKRLKAFFAITAASMLGGGAALFPLALLKSASESDFHEYDAAFGEGGFSGWEMVDGQYHITATTKNFWSSSLTGPYEIHYYNLINDYPVYVYRDGDRSVSFKQLINNELVNMDLSFSYRVSYDGSALSDDLSYGGGSSAFIDEGLNTFNIPVFASYDDLVSYVGSGDESLILNLDAYKDFKDAAPSAAKRFYNPLKNWLMKPSTLKDLPTTIKPVLDVSDANDGKQDGLDNVEDELRKIVPDPEPSPEPDPDPDPGVSTTPNYTTILDKILAVLKSILQGILDIPVKIMELPDLIWEWFKDPITAIKNVIVTLPGYWEDLMKLLQGFPAYLQGIWDGVLEIPIKIMELPDAIWEFFQNPLLAIKEAVLPIPDLLPDLVDKILLKLDAVVDAVKGLAPEADPEPAPEPDPPEPIDPDPPDPVDPEVNTPHANLLDGLLSLIYILFMLLKIFLHLLEFIINIFKIPADPGFITGDFRTGFDYIKSVELTGMGVSIYDFMMGLVHILLIFGIVKVLRRRIEKIQM